MSSSTKSALQYRSETTSTGNKIFGRFILAVLAAAPFVISIAASNWRSSKGLAADGSDLLQYLSSFGKMPRWDWLISAADFGDNLIANQEFYIVLGIVLTAAYVLYRNRAFFGRVLFGRP